MSQTTQAFQKPVKSNLSWVFLCPEIVTLSFPKGLPYSWTNRSLRINYSWNINQCRPPLSAPATQHGWGFFFFGPAIIFSFSIKGEETRSNSCKTVPRQRKLSEAQCLACVKPPPSPQTKSGRNTFCLRRWGGCSQATQYSKPLKSRVPSVLL